MPGNRTDSDSAPTDDGPVGGNPAAGRKGARLGFRLLCGAVLGIVSVAAADTPDPLAQKLTDPDPLVRLAAISQMTRHDLGATPSVLDALHDPDWRVRRECAFKLAKLGEVGRPGLLGALKSADPEVQRCAARALVTMGPEADVPALDTVAVLAKSKDHVLGTLLLELLRPTIDAVPRLVDLLRSPDTSRRCAAILALRKFGPLAQEAIPHLLHAFDDPELQVRKEASRTLGKVGPSAIPPLIRFLNDRTRRHRDCAVEAFAAVGPDAVPALISLLGSRDHDVLRYAIGALAWIGPAAADAVPALLALLEHEDIDVRRCAATTLGRLGKSAQPAVEDLRLMLPEGQYEYNATVALIRMGDPPPADMLNNLLESSHAFLRLVAVVTIQKRPDAAGPAITALGRMALGDREWKVREAAIRTLGLLSKSHAQAVPHLVAVIKASDYQARALAIKSLENAGQNGKEGIPVLIKCLDHHMSLVRARAIEALAVLGRGPDIREAISRAADDRDEHVRQVASRALEKLGPEQ